MACTTIAMLFYAFGLAHYIFAVLNDITNMCNKNKK